MLLKAGHAVSSEWSLYEYIRGGKLHRPLEDEETVCCAVFVLVFALVFALVLVTRLDVLVTDCTPCCCVTRPQLHEAAQRWRGAAVLRIKCNALKPLLDATREVCMCVCVCVRVCVCLKRGIGQGGGKLQLWALLSTLPLKAPTDPTQTQFDTTTHAVIPCAPLPAI